MEAVDTRAVLEAIPAAAYCCDPDGLIVRANRRAVALWGRTPRLNDPAERFSGAHRLYGPDGAPLDREQCWMARTLREQRAFTDHRVTVERPDGSRSDVATHANPLHDATGRLAGGLGVLLEMPDRPAAATAPCGAPTGFPQPPPGGDEAALCRFALPGLEAQKLDAIGRLTGGIAHDFNNLLAVILGNLELAQDLPGLPDAVAVLLREANAAGQRAKWINGSLVAFARRQPLQPETLDPGHLVARAAAMLGRMLGDAVAIEIALDVPLWPIRVDRAQLETALVNLAVNARDAMPDGGRLRFAVRNRAAGAEGGGALADQVMIEIADVGVGMTPETLARAFEPFFTTKPAGAGTGLGLAVVYGFMKQSGGHCRIESWAGRGTTVQLLFPRADAPAPAIPLGGAEAGGARAAPDTASAGRSVLLVEDVDGLRRLLVRQLSGLGFAVTAVEDAAAALAALEAGARPDLLLTDIVMPGAMDGTALARRVRELYPSVRILMMSGHAVDRAALDDTTPLLRKPFDREALATALEAVLEEPAATRGRS